MRTLLFGLLMLMEGAITLRVSTSKPHFVSTRSHLSGVSSPKFTNVTNLLLDLKRAPPPGGAGRPREERGALAALSPLDGA